MWRAERHHVAHLVHPGHAALDGPLGGAARDEAAHGVPHERDLIDVHGPLADDGVQQLRERPSVLGYAAAAVVADADRGATEVALQARAVRVAVVEAAVLAA